MKPMQITFAEFIRDVFSEFFPNISESHFSPSILRHVAEFTRVKFIRV